MHNQSQPHQSHIFMKKQPLAQLNRAWAAIQLVAHKALLGAVVSAALAGCAVTQTSSSAVKIASADSVALLPMANHTDVPQAGLRAEAIAEATLRAQGLRQLQIYPTALNPETLFEPSERKAQVEAEKWAKSQNIRYVVYGAVDEWRYKVGVDGEPAVGLVFHVKDLSSGQVVYSASGGKSGWSREALSAVAQKLSVQLLAGVQAAP
jgi:polysaccharide biosynthesis protein PelC